MMHDLWLFRLYTRISVFRPRHAKMVEVEILYWAKQGCVGVRCSKLGLRSEFDACTCLECVTVQANTRVFL